jgi:hypothetical protein
LSTIALLLCYRTLEVIPFMQIHVIVSDRIFIFFKIVMMFELRASHIRQMLYHLSHSATIFCAGYFRVARFTGMSHQLPAHSGFLKESLNYFSCQMHLFRFPTVVYESSQWLFCGFGVPELWNHGFILAR